MSKLKLVAQNSEQDLIEHQLDKEPVYWSCSKCYTRRKLTIGDVRYGIKCHKCGCEA